MRTTKKHNVLDSHIGRMIVTYRHNILQIKHKQFQWNTQQLKLFFVPCVCVGFGWSNEFVLASNFIWTRQIYVITHSLSCPINMSFCYTIKYSTNFPLHSRILFANVHFCDCLVGLDAYLAWSIGKHQTNGISHLNSEAAVSATATLCATVCYH